jgi:hypothetical protein
MPSLLGQGQHDLLPYWAQHNLVGIGLKDEDSCLCSQQQKEINSTFNLLAPELFF